MTLSAISAAALVGVGVANSGLPARVVGHAARADGSALLRVLFLPPLGSAGVVTLDAKRATSISCTGGDGGDDCCIPDYDGQCCMPAPDRPANAVSAVEAFIADGAAEALFADKSERSSRDVHKAFVAWCNREWPDGDVAAGIGLGGPHAFNKLFDIKSGDMKDGHRLYRKSFGNCAFRFQSQEDADKKAGGAAAAAGACDRTVRLSAKGQRRYAQGKRGMDWIRPTEEGTFVRMSERMGDHGRMEPVVVANNRWGVANVYWATDVEVTPPVEAPVKKARKRGGKKHLGKKRNHSLKTTM
eukprot:gene26390-40863_t